MRGRRPIIYLTLLILIAGCNNSPDPVTYTEPVPGPARIMAGNSPDDSNTGNADEKGLVWTLPQGWNESRATGMILSRITAPEMPGASITLSRLGGTGGGIDPNIQRWAGQLGLPPLTDAELAAVKSPLNHDEARGTFIDFNALPPVKDTTTKVCILEYPDFTVYLKITGNSGVISEFSDKVISFAQSISYK
ncbi:MAG: hypothetical protein JXL81_10450 [Deltaproteobacteria bacterium]|nr:hypothetical protein [Deltaproteobacteria bacterium]